MSSEQHTEMGKTRRKIDQGDEQNLLCWIKSHNPFTVSESLNYCLKALASGIIADESSLVDCDKAESIGQEIQESRDGVDIEQAKVKRKDGITTIDTITNSIVVDQQHITIKPKILFTRLTGILLYTILKVFYRLK